MTGEQLWVVAAGSGVSASAALLVGLQGGNPWMACGGAVVAGGVTGYLIERWTRKQVR